jgi:hypothetical protein
MMTVHRTATLTTRLRNTSLPGRWRRSSPQQPRFKCTLRSVTRRGRALRRCHEQSVGMIDAPRSHGNRQAAESPRRCGSRRRSGADFARSVGISVAFGVSSSLASALLLDRCGCVRDRRVASALRLGALAELRVPGYQPTPR